MSLDDVKKFMQEWPLLVEVAGGAIVLFIGAVGGLLWYRGRGKTQPGTGGVSVKAADDAPTQVAGDGAKQDMRVDRSTQEAKDAGVVIKDSPGAVVYVTNVANQYYYQDRVPTSPVADVRSLFAEGLEHYKKGQFEEAIEKFSRCLRLEPDAGRRGALNLQIGNCYYELRRYANALESYREALEVYRKDQYPVDYAMTQNNLGNAYGALPSTTAEERAANVRQAIEAYREALEIRKKDRYPVDYAMTQNNLGTAYTALPSATAEERAANVRKAIEAYREALEIRKKDQYPVHYATTQNNLGTAYEDLPAATAEERAANVRQAIEAYREALEVRRKDQYPQDYCFTAANLGLALAETGPATQACYWLREAYSLRQFLPDQGKSLEDVMKRVCR